MFKSKYRTNVLGQNTYRNKDEGLSLLRETIGQINRSAGTAYSFTMALLNAADYGIPQERERFFIVGLRSGSGFRFPAPTHWRPQEGPSILGPDAFEPYRTAWDAIGDLEDDDNPELRLTGKWAALLPSIPEGHNYLHHTARGEGLPLFGWRRRYWSFLLKLSKRLPSWTITAQPGPAIGPFHWGSRRLSARELARLQTFPDSYTIVGPLRSAQKQLGNAVPCALAEILGLEIRRALGDKLKRRPASLLPPRRTPIPPPEKVGRVVARYRPLAGDHEAHPGTGRGYGARDRLQAGGAELG
jgi:DNA (cytosine-5)-methyltransferase 1